MEDSWQISFSLFVLTLYREGEDPADYGFDWHSLCRSRWNDFRAFCFHCSIPLLS